MIRRGLDVKLNVKPIFRDFSTTIIKDHAVHKRRGTDSGMKQFWHRN